MFIMYSIKERVRRPSHEEYLAEKKSFCKNSFSGKEKEVQIEEIKLVMVQHPLTLISDLQSLKIMDIFFLTLKLRTFVFYQMIH